MPASHVDDEACVSFCMLREGKSANDRGEHARCHPHHASGSFICRESFSVYSRGIATLATLATLGANLLKKFCAGIFVGWFVITPPPFPLYFFFNFNLGVAMVAMVAML